MTLLICRTCPRYDAHASGTFGRAMAAAIGTSQVAGVAVRGVQCLGACPDDGVVAVDGPGKARVRFDGLDVGHAAAVVDAAAAHAASSTGVPDDWQVPEQLTGKISAVTLKRPLPA